MCTHMFIAGMFSRISNLTHAEHQTKVNNLLMSTQNAASTKRSSDNQDDNGKIIIGKKNKTNAVTFSFNIHELLVSNDSYDIAEWTSGKHDIIFSYFPYLCFNVALGIIHVGEIHVLDENIIYLNQILV